ncbi:MAG: phosphoribosylanthranilate isomerase [Bdellovibrionota bacterium]
MIRVKICGITSVADALLAARAGANAIGLIFHDKSPRNVTPQRAKDICSALPPLMGAVGVFVNESAEKIQEIRDQVGFGYVQLSGEESPEMAKAFGRRAIKVLRLKTEADLTQIESYAPTVGAFLLDTPKEGVYGGTGKTGDWSLYRRAVERATRLGRPVILAGGLTPENVGEAVRQVKPFAVDTASGTEKSMGVKAADKVTRFVREAVAAGLSIKS